MKVLVAKVASKAARLKKCDPNRVLARAQEVEYQAVEDALEEHEGPKFDARLAEVEKMGCEMKNELAADSAFDELEIRQRLKSDGVIPLRSA